MDRIQRVLVALSGAETDRHLVTYARLLASLGLARHYHFVHVRPRAHVDAPAQKGERRGVSPTCIPDAQLVEAFKAQVAQHFANHGRDITHSCHVVEGARIDELTEFVSQQRCDLVLLGHRKSRSGQRSLARRLAMIAPCSVWMVPEGAPVSITDIMTPIDFSHHSADCVEVATSIARAADITECSATHVFADASTVHYDESVDEIRRNKEQAFERFLRSVDRHDVRVAPSFLEGNNVARTILYAADQRRADLLVMSTRGRSTAAAILLGSVTTQVMVETPIAILVVKHFGAMMNLFQALRQSHFWTRNNPKTN